MRTPVKIRHLPTRLATGAFILNAGLIKLDADDEAAKNLHATASTAYPMSEQVDRDVFVKALAATEVALGAALVAPVVPTRMAALGLAAYSGGLLGMYMRIPGMRQHGSIRPTQDGMALAKDVWMAGIALTMLMDSGGSKKRKRSKSKKD